MKVVVALLVALFVAVAVAELSESELRLQFAKFTRKFEKFYGQEEGENRYNIFKQNLERIKIMNSNKMDGAEYGITKFTDLTPEEFKQIYLMNTVDATKLTAGLKRVTPAPADVPASFDWRTKGAVTPVKNQGSCGSCWSFSTTGNIEGRWFLAGNTLVSLSEQNLVDCDHTCDSDNNCDGGCNGGLPSLAYQYVMKTGGIDTEASYPYEGLDDTCRFKNASVGAKIQNWEAVSTDEAQILNYVYQHGPVSIALNAGWLQYYMGGVSDPLWCSPKNIDHAVLIVGFGTEKGVLGEHPYWLVKNSWGSDWGEQGYFKIIRGKGKCGLNLYVTSSIV